MSDLETIRTILIARGVGFDIATPNNDPIVTTLSLRATEHDHVIGYSGFEARLTFDRNGALLGVGVWE